MFSISFRKHRNKKKKNHLLTWIIKMYGKFSMLTLSLRPQLMLVLCLHRVIETRFFSKSSIKYYSLMSMITRRLSIDYLSINSWFHILCCRSVMILQQVIQLHEKKATECMGEESSQSLIHNNASLKAIYDLE